jgi:pimeloyl-ACP methyl ester carboxylesterase
MLRLPGYRWVGIERSARGAVNPALLALALCVVASAASAQSLHVDCRGERTNAPTVILESGAFGTSADWDLVLDDLAKAGRVCAYDRAGVGASPPRAGDEDVVSIARELAGLLDTLGETQPVIVVGHSNGALYAEAFAALMPQRVAGLVYVNGVTSNDLAEPLLVADLTRERHASDLAVTAARLGLAAILADAMTRSETLPRPASESKRRALSRLRRLKIARDEDRAIVPGLSAVAALGGSPASIPTVAITSIPPHPSTSEETWVRAEAVPGRRAVAGWVLTLPGGTHTSPLARDRAYVDVAVEWLRGLATTPPR